jgi:hypothetical protein
VLARYNAVNARAEEAAKKPFQAYGGEFVAPLTDVQQQGISQTQQYSQAAQPYYTRAAGMTEDAVRSSQPLTAEQIQQYQNPYIQSVVDPTLKALQQQQAIDRNTQTAQAIRSGGFGGTGTERQRAMTAGQQELAQAQAISPLYADAYKNALATAQQQQQLRVGTGMQGAQQYAGIGTGAQQAGLQGAQATIGAGTLGQQTQQALDTAKYQQFLQERGYDFQTAQFLANIAEGTGALSGSTTTTTQPTSFFSDERLKHDIKQIGKTNDGQPIYSFKYKGDNRTQIGLLAQEVEKKHPEAVGLSGGYKTVDYAKATASSRHARAMGGLVPESMGGAVYEPGNYSRGGFAYGGDPEDLKAILAQQSKSFGPFAQGGLYGASAQQNPHGNAAGYVPKASLHTPKLVTSNFQPRQQQGEFQSALQNINAAGSAAKTLGAGYDWAETKYDKLTAKPKTDPNETPDSNVAGPSDKTISDTARSGNIKPPASPSQMNPSAPKTTGFGIDEYIDPNLDPTAFAPTVAHGGGIMPRHGYAIGGTPYSNMPDFSSGYMDLIDYTGKTPAELKSEFDAQRAGQMPKQQQQQGGLGNALGDANKIYKVSNDLKPAYEKASNFFSSPTPAGDLATKYPAAPSGTPMPTARPPGLGGGQTAAADLPSANAVPTSFETGQAGFVVPGQTATTAATAPVAETAATITPIAPVAEAAGAGAAEAAGALGAAGAAEAAGAAAGTAAAAGEGAAVAEGLGSLMEFLPLLLLKDGGRIPRYSGGLVPRQAFGGNEPGGAVQDPLAAYDPKDLAIRTIAAETSGHPEETAGIAAVVRNRLASGNYGPDYRSVVTAKNQFEPWNNPQGANYPLRIDPESDRYKQAAAALTRHETEGYDPTDGATHFWAPKAQAALGRKAPSWDNENAKDIGATRFVKVDASGAPRQQVQQPQQSYPLQDQIEGGFGKAKSIVNSMVPSDYKGRDVNAQGEQRGWGDFLTSKDFVIPLLTGLGTMASSPSRYLGAAILQGLGGGAQAFANLQQQQAQVGREVAGTGLTEAQTRGVDITNVQKSFQSIPSIGNFVWIRTPAGPKFVSGGEYKQMVDSGQTPELLGTIPPDGEKVIKQKFGITESTAPGAPQVSTTGVKPPAGGTTEAQPTGTKPSTVSVGAVPAGVNFDDESRRRAKNETLVTWEGGPGATSAAEQSKKYAQTSETMASAARDSQRYIRELGETLAQAGTGRAFAAPGTAASARGSVINAANTIARGLGVPQINDSLDTSVQKAEKLQTMFAAMQAQGGNQESYAALNMLKSAIANPNMNPQAYADLAASLMVNNMRMMEREQHRLQYGNISNGIYTGAGSDFERTNDPRKYTAEQEVMKNLILKDPKLFKQLSSGAYNADQINEAFRKLGVSGMSKYFLGGM